MFEIRADSSYHGARSYPICAIFDLRPLESVAAESLVAAHAQMWAMSRNTLAAEHCVRIVISSLDPARSASALTLARPFVRAGLGPAISAGPTDSWDRPVVAEVSMCRRQPAVDRYLVRAADRPSDWRKREHVFLAEYDPVRRYLFSATLFFDG